MPKDTGKTFNYASAFYKACVDNSEVTVIEGEAVNLWKGFIGKTCRSLQVPKGMDNRIIKALESIGSIQFIQRGVGNWPTILALRYPPTEDLWADSDAVGLTRRESYGRLLSRVKSLENSIGGGNVVEALVALNARVDQLDQEVRELRKVQKGGLDG